METIYEKSMPNEELFNLPESLRSATAEEVFEVAQERLNLAQAKLDKFYSQIVDQRASAEEHFEDWMRERRIYSNEITKESYEKLEQENEELKESLSLCKERIEIMQLEHAEMEAQLRDDKRSVKILADTLKDVTAADLDNLHYDFLRDTMRDVFLTLIRAFREIKRKK